MRFAYTFKSINHRQFSLKPYHKGGNVVYTDVGDLSQRLLTTYNQLIVIDEGYFVAKNIDVLKRQVKELSDTLSAVRNRGHIVMICFIKFNRAAKTILEVMNYWIHKPNPDWGILYIRDREFIGDDPWAVEDLLKAKTLNKKRWLLRHNPNYIMSFKVKPLKKRIFDQYEKYKQEAQEEKGKTSCTEASRGP